MSQMEMNFDRAPEPKPAGQKRIVVFDVETRFSADDVGGWGNKNLMRVAVAVAHDSADGEFKVFYEEQMNDLLALLKSADLVVGFNSRRFDYDVLGGYTKEPLATTLPTLDIMEELEKRLGFRIKLDNVAQNTLGVGKTGDGMQSLQWVSEGKLDMVRDYCIQDVRVTLDVFNYAVEKGELFYSGKKGARMSVKLDLDLEKFYKK